MVIAGASAGAPILAYDCLIQNSICIVMTFFHHPGDFDSYHFLLSERDELTPKEGSETALQGEGDTVITNEGYCR